MLWLESEGEKGGCGWRVRVRRVVVVEGGRVCIRMGAYMCSSVHARVSVICVCVNAHVCVQVCTSTIISGCVQTAGAAISVICVGVCMHVCVCVCKYVCVCKCALVPLSLAVSRQLV